MKINLIIIDGLNGSGKSTVAKLLHKKLPRTALISYDEIKRLISDFEPKDEYLQLTAKVIQAMIKQYLSNNVSVIIEFFAPKAEYVKAYTKLAKTNKDLALFVYQIEAPLDVRMQRIQARPLQAGAKRKMDKAWIMRNDENYHANKYTEATVFDSGKLSAGRIVNEMLKGIRS